MAPNNQTQGKRAMQAKVVIIGGGFGGLTAAKKLKNSPLDVLVIDRTNHHLFQPLLYQVASASISPRDIALPIREILRKQKNTSVIMGEVVGIDKKNKKVLLGNGDAVSFEYLIVATGARHSYFGNERWEAHAPGLKTISDALRIREQILISFEKAERMNSVEGVEEKYLNFVVIGGGPTGVEMAGAIAEISRKTLFKNFKNIRPEKSKIYLVEALPYVLPVYPEKLRIRAKEDLEKLGVTVLTGKKVTDIHEEGVQVEDMFIRSNNVIWAAGNQASSLLKTLDVPLDRQGRVIVEPDMSIPGEPNIFVIGDASQAKNKEGNLLPGIAPTAIQQGAYVAKIILKGHGKEKRPPFSYFDKGCMATIGKGEAVAMIGKLNFAGFLAWATWSFIHILYLIGFRNKAIVFLEWIVIYFTGERGVRLIYRSLEGDLPKKDNPPQ